MLLSLRDVVNLEPLDVLCISGMKSSKFGSQQGCVGTLYLFRDTQITFLDDRNSHYAKSFL